MTESPSNTSNHQRLDEMLVHLTPVGAVVPYNVCFDSSGDLWVATKGGLFKFQNKSMAFEMKNAFPKKIAPYCQVVAHKDKIIYVQTDDKAALTEFRILNLNGEVKHEQFFDGKIQSLAVNDEGEIFMTKQPVAGEDESIIYKSTIDAPLGWDELSSAYDYCFQALCVYDSNTLFVATTSLPINMYAKQTLKIVDSKTGKIRKTFSSAGKEPGSVYFPRSIQTLNDQVLVLDKTGRVQRFEKDGQFVDVAASIDAYLGNGFTVNNEEAVIACSGIVLDKNSQTICDDWIETIKLDGSSWTPTPKA
ncbi:hypothetical protein M3Y94_00163400 [Aphelenchoides besseyi]|nr:hypothetical protein M3Y94_00163400 [Aphelenchoides besseyi]KAI6237045.1 hypothetical protein M3Y95_00223800 [Aphelenchoides besseyi]